MRNNSYKISGVIKEEIVFPAVAPGFDTSLCAASSTAMSEKKVEQPDELLARRKKRTPAQAEQDQLLAAAFARFERKHIGNPRSRTPEQLRIIRTPLGFKPE